MLVICCVQFDYIWIIQYKQKCIMKWLVFHSFTRLMKKKRMIAYKSKYIVFKYITILPRYFEKKSRYEIFGDTHPYWITFWNLKAQTPLNKKLYMVLCHYLPITFDRWNNRYHCQQGWVRWIYKGTPQS